MAKYWTNTLAIWSHCYLDNAQYAPGSSYYMFLPLQDSKRLDFYKNAAANQELTLVDIWRQFPQLNKSNWDKWSQCRILTKFSWKKFLVLLLSTLVGWKIERTIRMLKNVNDTNLWWNFSYSIKSCMKCYWHLFGGNLDFPKTKIFCSYESTFAKMFCNFILHAKIYWKTLN